VKEGTSSITLAFFYEKIDDDEIMAIRYNGKKDRQIRTFCRIVATHFVAGLLILLTCQGINKDERR
jgi:hypothetical protein